MTLHPCNRGNLGVVPTKSVASIGQGENAECVEHVWSIMAGNSQLMFSSLTLCEKEATTPRSPRASGPSSRNIGEASEISIVVTRLLECGV